MRIQRVKVKNLKDQIGSSKLQTGPVQINNDFAGVFIDERDCVQIWMSLNVAIQTLGKLPEHDGTVAFAQHALENLQASLKAAMKQEDVARTA